MEEYEHEMRMINEWQDDYSVTKKRYIETRDAFLVTKANYLADGKNLDTVKSLFKEMKSLESSLRDNPMIIHGNQLPSPSDRQLPVDLFLEAEDIGLRLFRRARKTIDREIKDTIYKNQNRGQEEALVAKFMELIPEDDPDVIEYKNLYVKAKNYEMPSGPPSPPGMGTSRRARARRNRKMYKV